MSLRLTRNTPHSRVARVKPKPSESDALIGPGKNGVGLEFPPAFPV